MLFILKKIKSRLIQALNRVNSDGMLNSGEDYKPQKPMFQHDEEGYASTPLHLLSSSFAFTKNVMLNLFQHRMSERQSDPEMNSGRRAWRGMLAPYLQPAFTLAEVLITLGIIGIVAQVTIPVMVKDFQQQVLNSQFKKAYTTMYNATLLVKANNDGILPACRYDPSGGWGAGSANSECTLFFNELKKALGVVKSCDNNSYANGCVPNYTDNAVNGTGVGFYAQNYLLNVNSSFVLKDGVIVVPYEASWAPLFMMDINGAKKPNKWGFDMFSFFWTGDQNGVRLRPENYFTPGTGGVNTTEMLKRVFNQ